jgi:hypothetical protein
MVKERTNLAVGLAVSNVERYPAFRQTAFNVNLLSRGGIAQGVPSTVIIF